MKFTLYILLLALTAFTGWAQDRNIREATAAEVTARAVGLPAVLTPRNAGGFITNNQRMAYIGNTLLFNVPSRWFISGDSLSVDLTTNGWLSYGGITNTISGGRTNGQVWYQSSLGGGPWNANTVSKWWFVTNLFGVNKGYTTELDTALCVPGQALWNIIGGVPAQYSTKVDQSISGTYSADGTYTNLLRRGQTHAYVPLSANDLGIVTTNFGLGTLQTNTCAVGTNVLVTVGGSGGYFQYILLGTPSASVTAKVFSPAFAGGQTTANFPYASNGNLNNGTNNRSPVEWMTTNAPTRTGTNAGAILLAGGNDFTGGWVGDYTTAPTYFVTNQYLWVWSNTVTWARTNRALGYWPVIVSTYPLNYNFRPSNSSQAQSSNNVVRYNQLVRSNWATIADAFIDLEATNTLYGNLNANYIDGTHPTTGFAGGEGTNIFNGLRFNRILKASSY